jgi:spore coat polysaccharide biosynthesis protein SpsF
MTATVAIIQARMTSTRLPGKVLAELAGKPALEHMIGRVRRARRLTEIVVATTVNDTDDAVVALCERLEVRVVRGDEADVLGRFARAAEVAGGEVMVRLTADCPMSEPAFIDRAVAMFLEGDWDYVSNSVRRTYPFGLEVEVFSRRALDEAAREARHPYLREHVTPYITGKHPDLPHGDFAIGDMTLEADFSHVRWAIDTPQDLERCRRLFALLPEDFTWLEALAVATREPELLGLSSGAAGGDEG